MTDCTVCHQEHSPIKRCVIVNYDDASMHEGTEE